MNILQPRAAQLAEEAIFSRGYETTYEAKRFSARGENCIAIKSYPNPYMLYAELDERAPYEFLGSCEAEPTTEEATELLNANPAFKLSKNMRAMNRY